MVFDIDDLIARKFQFRLNSRSWILSELTAGDRAEIGNVMRGVVPNPLTDAKEACRDLPPATAKEIWKEAKRQYAYWPPLPESEDGQAYLFSSREVQQAVLYHGLKRNQTVTQDEVKALVDSIPYQTALIKLLMFAITGRSADDPKDSTSQASTGTI
jgi:hypothetical protein